MSFADLDNDGDLDIVVNNFAKPSVRFENRLCGGELALCGRELPDATGKERVAG